MPSLSREDVLHAYDLFGTPPAYVRGKMTKRPIKQETIDDRLVMTEKKKKLYTDVMKYEGNMFLITVCDPLNLTLNLDWHYKARSMYYVVMVLYPR